MRCVGIRGETDADDLSASALRRQSLPRRMAQSLVDEAGAGRLFQRLGQRPIFIAIGAANRGDPLEMVLRLFAVTLLDLPKTVIIPGQHMVWIRFERAFIPNL